jgi:periplasmic copper chaperone A
MKTGKRRQEAGKEFFGFMPVLLLISLVAFQIPAPGGQSPVPGIKIENPYIRVAAQGMTSAGYFKISNSSDEADTLYAVKADFSMMAQLHESFRKNGMVGMKEIKFVVIPAKSSVTFKPGGYHVMLMKVEYDLKPGMKVHIFLMFRHAGEIEIDVPVK